MSGGIFNKQDKVRPGIYQNIYTNNIQNVDNEIDKTVAIALDLDFGAEQAITKIEKESDIYNKLGYTLDDKKVLLLKEIMKATNKIIVYRLNSGEKAKATVNTDKVITAKHGGTKGNDISVVISNNVEDEKKYNIYTYLEGVLVDEQVISNYEEFESNNFITIEGTGAITETANVKLSGGTSTSTTQETEETSYTKFLEVLELEHYAYLAYTGTNDKVKALIVSFIKRMNDEEGVRAKAVMGEYAADYEKIITIKNGVVLEDGTILTNAQCAAYFAGLSASSDINISNTYTQYPGASDVSPRLNNADTIKALKSGNIVFTRRSKDDVVIEQDINSLVTYTSKKNNSFSKNRFIRAIDTLASDIKEIFEENFIGKLNSNEDGRSILRAEIIKNIKEKEKMGAFQNFSEEDVSVTAGDQIDGVLIAILVQPIDSIEKIYMNVEVQ